MSKAVRACRYKCAIILCDGRWVDPDLDSSNGIQMREAKDMLRFDSMLMLVQLNIRKLLEVRPIPECQTTPRACQRWSNEQQGPSIHLHRRASP